MGTEDPRRAVHDPVRRRLAIRAVLRSVLTAAVVVTAYFVLPITSTFRLGTVLTLLGGLTVVGLALTWQIRSILVSEAPAAQAVGALVVSVALFLVVYSAIYFATGKVEPSSWSEPMSRMDSLYYTVSVFTTVGFGDITALSQTTRALTAVQMVTGFLLVAVIARVVVGAVQVNLRRRQTGGSG